MVNWNNTFQFDLQQLRLTNLLTGRHCALTRNEGLMLQALVEGTSTKHDLIHAVWTRHHAVVTENSYYQLVSLLRKSFGSIDLPGMIVTLPRKGLSLAQPVPGTEPAAVAAAATGATSEARSPMADCASSSAGMRMRPRLRFTKHWRICAATLGCIALIAALSAAPGGFVQRGKKDRPAQSSAGSDAVSFASLPQSTIITGDTTIHYSKMHANTALRVWRDVQARAEIPPEQNHRVYITQHRNRYAVLACSEPADPRNIRCLTVTIPD